MSDSSILFRQNPAKCCSLRLWWRSQGWSTAHTFCVFPFFCTCFNDLISGHLGRLAVSTTSVLPPSPIYCNFSLPFSSGSRKHPPLRTSSCFWLVRKRLKRWPKPVETFPSTSLMAARRWRWCLFMLLCPTLNSSESFRLRPRWGNVMC